MSVVTIPNKQIYQKEKDELQRLHNQYKGELDELSRRRDEIAAEQTNAMNVNLSDATQALKSIKKSVSEFNSQCDLLQIPIHQNNEALTSLRDNIKIDIATATATAAAKKSQEDAALSVIKNTITTKIADINREFAENQTDDTTQLDKLMNSDLDDVNMPTDITEETQAMIRTYNDDKNDFLTDKRIRIDAIKEKYNTQKQAHQQKLTKNIEILNGLSGSNYIIKIGKTLSKILNDKNPNPIDEIKKEIIQLKDDLETEQGSFIDRKKAIDEAIQIDIKLSELNATLVKLEDTQGNIFKTFITVRGRRYDTIDVDKSPIQAVITSELTKATGLSDPTRKSAIILRVEGYIQRFDRNIIDIEKKLNEINTESPNSKKIIIEGLKERIVLLKAAKSRYQEQVEQIKTQILATSARSGSPSPNPSRSPSPNPVAAEKAEDTRDVSEGPDEMSTSLMTNKLNGRNRPLFQGVPQNKKRRYIYVPPTINKTDPIYLIDLDEATSGGGKIIQHGGAPLLPDTLPETATIYVLDPVYDDNIMLLASLDAPSRVLNNDRLIQNLKGKGKKTDTTVYPKIKKGLISSYDEGVLAIARRAVYKSSILKLMDILDNKIPRKKGLNTYSGMYIYLWSFVNPNDAAGVIKKLAPHGTQESNFRFSPNEISIIVGWTPGTTNNPNLDNYFGVFTKCGRVQSTFLDNVIKRKGTDDKLTSDKNSAYRFKLNWIILIAFYCLQNPSSNIKYENVGELIINTYDTLLGWITADTYNGMFFRDRNPILKNSVVTYSDGVDKKIKGDIAGDTTFTQLKTKIIEKICESTMTDDAKNHDDDPEEEKDQEFFPDTDSEGGSSDWTSDDGDTSSRSSLSSARLAPPSTPISPDTERLKQISEIARGQGQGQGPTRPTGVTMLNISKLPSSSPPQTVSSARFTRRIKSDNTKQPQTYRDYTSPYRQTSESLRTRKIREKQVVPEQQPQPQLQPFRRRPLAFNRVSPEHGLANTTVKDNSSLPEYNTGSHNVLLPNPRPTRKPIPPLRPSKAGKGRTRKHRRDKHRHKYTRKFTRIV
jgi:hypothetical protein